METTKSFTKEDCGIWLDCSAQSADTLNLRTISLANAQGGKIDLPVEGEDYSEMLGYAGDEAVDFLNTLCSDDVSFEFEDNSLFLRENDEQA